jgi:manganese/zinc/iron transport system permease protein
MKSRRHTHTMRSTLFALLGAAVPLMAPSGVLAGSLAELSLELPAWDELLRVLTLQDYNTRVVIVGTTLLGLAAGLVGTFLILRKRALLSDTLSHATLPGIALAFIVVTLMGGEGKNLVILITGAAVFSVLGTGSVLIIQRYTRLKDDAALGIVLSVYFGLGIALLGLATRMETGTAAGLTSFIYGKTASMLLFDAMLIGGVALGSAIFCLLFFKEFSMICFDHDYAATQGWPVLRLDFLMMTLVVVVTVIGLQAVGLILVVALLIIPPAAARFWTFRLRNMLLLSGGFGALSGLLGSGVSALMANLPAGAVIVLMASAVFIFSLAFGSARGFIRLAVERYRLKRKITRENILREMYEYKEQGKSSQKDGQPVSATEHVAVGQSFEELLASRSWTAGHLGRNLKHLRADGLVADQNGIYSLTADGIDSAGQVVRKHRLWETYLLTHADVAPGQVDWGADEIEHVLDHEMIAKLEKLLPEVTTARIPPSPHKLQPAKGT